jgi:hypothetical protein
MMASGMISRGAEAEQDLQLFPTGLGTQMAFKLHCVVQYPANDNEIILYPVNQQVAGLTDDAKVCTRTFPAQAQVPGTDIRAKFRTLDAADALRLRGKITQCRNDKTLISQTRVFAELRMRPAEDFDDVILRGGG